MLDQKADTVWWRVGTVGLSVVALSVSIRSCAISNYALSLSETSFVTGSRPYLLVSSYKPKTWDSFIKCTSTPAGTKVAVAFKVENVGDTPAYATRVDAANIEMHFTNSKGEDVTDRIRLDIQWKQPDGLTLGPKEKYQVEAYLALDNLGDQTDRMKRLLDVGAQLPVEVSVSYDAILGDKTTRHISVTKALLYRDRAVILASEMR